MEETPRSGGQPRLSWAHRPTAPVTRRRGVPPARALAETSSAGSPDPWEPVTRLLRDLRSRSCGLSQREAARRLERYGPSTLSATTSRTWPRALARQFTQPLAVLLMLAAVLSVGAGTPQLAWAIAAVVLLNALFAFVQENQASRAVEALGRYLPAQAQARRDGGGPARPHDRGGPW